MTYASPVCRGLKIASMTNLESEPRSDGIWNTPVYYSLVSHKLAYWTYVVVPGGHLSDEFIVDDADWTTPDDETLQNVVGARHVDRQIRHVIVHAFEALQNKQKLLCHDFLILTCEGQISNGHYVVGSRRRVRSPENEVYNITIRNINKI